MALPDDLLTDWYQVWYYTGTMGRKEMQEVATAEDAHNWSDFAAQNGWEGVIIIHNHLEDGVLTRTAAT